jgi:hypothetical protein
MKRIYDVLAVVAVILTPVAMMAAAGWEAYAATLLRTGQVGLSIATGIATAASMEAIGILAGETTLLFHGRVDRRWRIAGIVLLAYVTAGLSLLWGTALVFLPPMAGAVYVLVGLRSAAEREEIKAAEQGEQQQAVEDAAAAAERAWQHEQWRIRQDDRTRVRLAEIELAQSQHRAESASTQPAPSGQSQQACADCGRTFATVQALNAHRRHCTGVPIVHPMPDPATIRSNGHAGQ